MAPIPHTVIYTQKHDTTAMVVVVVGVHTHLYQW